MSQLLLMSKLDRFKGKRDLNFVLIGHNNRIFRIKDIGSLEATNHENIATKLFRSGD